MCGIVGYFGKDAGARAREAIGMLAIRGKEAAGIWFMEASDAPGQSKTVSDNEPLITATPEELPIDHHTSGALAHTLHAMVGCVPQPVRSTGPHKGVLIMNAEIYNWRAIATQHGIVARNDTDVLLHLLEEQPNLDEHAIAAVCEQLDGVYAFAYYRAGVVAITRDAIGVKPLWYAVRADGTFAFASERVALTAIGLHGARELYPRMTILFDTRTRALHETSRPFFTIEPEHDTSEEEQIATVARLFREAVEKRVPETTFGILLSGGVDSSAIAAILRERKPPCYVVGSATSPDVRMAQLLAAVYKLQLTILSPTMDELEAELPEIIATVDDANPVKLSVAATFWFACKAAERDGVRCLFSGLGSEELFAGYERHRRSTEPNKECLAGLRKLHERDLYRDDVITMHHGIELRLPFLDRALVAYALRIPAKYKIREGRDKAIFRDAAYTFEVPNAIVDRPKKAAQYGSGTMQAIVKLAKRARAPSVAEYFGRHRGEPNRILAILLSGGKDSVLAMHIMDRMHYAIRCAVTIESDNKDSYLYHTPNTALTKLQADAMRIPLLTARTEGEPEHELGALRDALRAAKSRYGIEGVVTGAIGSQYQRERIEKLCDELGLTTYNPLWQMREKDELQMLLRQGFEVIITKVAAEGLDASWLGARLTEARIAQLLKLQERYGIHPAGEGGEYESLVLDAPLFRERIVIGATQVIKDGSAAMLQITDARLESKQGINSDEGSESSSE